jgi:hypothetical protein
LSEEVFKYGDDQFFLVCYVGTNTERLCVELCEFMQCHGEKGSSVSIVSGYGLDDWAIEVRSPAEAKDFSFSLYVVTGSGAHSASCPMGTGAPFPGAKARPGRDADHSPHLLPRSNMSRSYTSSHPKRVRSVWSDCFSFYAMSCRFVYYFPKKK